MSFPFETDGECERWLKSRGVTTDFLSRDTIRQAALLLATMQQAHYAIGTAEPDEKDGTTKSEALIAAVNRAERASKQWDDFARLAGITRRES